MIFHIYGSDSFWVQDEVKKTGASVIFHAEDVEEAKQFIEHTASEGLFGAFNDVVLVSKKKDVGNLVDGKKAKTIQAKTLTGKALSEWIQAYITKDGFVLAVKAEQALLELKDMWKIKNTLDMLMNYCQNTKKITTADIAMLAPTINETNIFHFVDAVTSRQKGTALTQLQHHLDGDVDPYYLHAMLVKQFRNILQVKSGGKISAHPYVIQKTTEQARRYELNDLTKFFITLHDAELNAKQGVTSLEDSLFSFITIL